MREVFLDSFENRKDMCEQFYINESELDGYNVIVAAYDTGDYSGDAFVLLEKDGKYFEVNGSHCSCYGLENQWGLEDTDSAALKIRADSKYSYGGFGMAKGVLKDHFGW